MVLVGPSGSGKSTALRMLAGLEDNTGGSIRIGDRVVDDVEPKDRDLAMVFQSYALYPHMTVAENMGFALKMQGVAKAEIAAARRRRGREARDHRRCWSAGRRRSRAASASAWRSAARSCATPRRS